MLQCFWLQYVLGWSSAFAGICLFCYQYLVALWWFSLMIIMVVSDRQHLTFICFFCNPAVSCNLFFGSVLTWLLCSSFCVRENYFWQLFLVFSPQDIDNCIYRDYTVKLKTYLILILYLLLSVFVCGTDLIGSLFLRLSVYQRINEIISNVSLFDSCLSS